MTLTSTQKSFITSIKEKIRLAQYETLKEVKIFTNKTLYHFKLSLRQQSSMVYNYNISGGNYS
jgi:hypothetical protein